MPSYDPDTSITLADLADERQCSVARLRQLCQQAKVRIPKHERLPPSGWKKLDAYIYTHYHGCAAGQPLPRA